MGTATLAPVTNRVYHQTFRRGPGSPTRRECWGADTADGQWRFVREESPGTPWLVYHLPSVEDGSYTLPVQFCGTLRACRAAVAQGWAAQRLAAHKAEEAARL